MFDTRLIALLDHPDATRRGQAVKALAKSKDREALDYLHDVELYDDDEAVRELARKARIYIETHAPLPIDDTPLTDDDVYVPSYLDEARPSVPLYDPITGVDERAERERVERAASPVLQLENKSDQEKRAKKQRRRAGRDPIRTWHYMIILATIALCGGALFAFLTMEWYDFSTEDFLPDSLENRPINAEYDFRLYASSIDTLSGNWTFEQAQQGLTETWEREENQTMEYTLLLIPLNAVFQIGIGALILVSGKRAEGGFWMQMIALSLVALVPFGWALYNVKSSLLDFPRMYQVLELDHTITDFMGMGFWVMLACTLVVFLLGFCAKVAFDEE